MSEQAALDLGAIEQKVSGSSFYVSANVDGLNIASINVGSANTTPTVPELESFTAPTGGTFGAPITVSAVTY